MAKVTSIAEYKDMIQRAETMEELYKILEQASKNLEYYAYNSVAYVASQNAKQIAMKEFNQFERDLVRKSYNEVYWK